MNIHGDTLPKIFEIVNLFTKSDLPSPGKTHIQKICYFLKFQGEDLGYRFKIYHYGPYSFDLANDLEELAALELIEIKDRETAWGNSIEITREGRKYNKKDISLESKNRIADIVEKLGEKTAKDLGIFATLHFVQKALMRREKEKPGKDKVVEETHDMKPMFEENYIAGQYDALEALELI